ncbi:MAG TPA: glycosyltransferase family 4 protein [Candidatus Eremiobacteraceae bacterium]|jgi:glycosyltransferase involved in cell wall biosynthesis
MATTYVVLSFEGPDVYSRAGGLGVRAAELSQALAARGNETHLYFVGDPSLPAEEKPHANLTWHRWCQWVSHYHPAGVYDGEWGKVEDFGHSVPLHVLHAHLKPAYMRGDNVIVLAEEWQTAEASIALRSVADRDGCGRALEILWNANNVYGFERIDWIRLARATTITTISRWMKHMMAMVGQEPLIIPNGIPAARIAKRVDAARTREVASAFGGGLGLVKFGRFDLDKRWLMAVDAVAELKRLGRRPKLVMRGGVEPHGDDVRARIRGLGLSYEALRSAPGGLAAAIAGSRADVVELQFFVSDEDRDALYAAADAVLANSGREPFGLVGLEVMAVGGVAVTGATGEDYAIPFDNALTVDTDDGAELAAYLARLQDMPAVGKKIRTRGIETAARFTWDHAIDILERKIEYVRLAR